MSRSDSRAEALRRLPVVYARALELRDLGVSDADIAQRLDIELKAVGPLLTVAEAKMKSILNGSSPAKGREHLEERDQ